MHRALWLGLSVWLLSSVAVGGDAIERIWLTHRSPTPEKITVNWETAAPGPSSVHFGPTPACEEAVSVEESVTLHHVEIPLRGTGGRVHYNVQSGERRSAVYSFKEYPTDELRVAVGADWQNRPSLDAILKDDIHLMLSCGDHVDSLHSKCGAGVKDCVIPFATLIEKYPELFRSTPFLPVLGNHDREIRPRGPKPPAEAVYDIDATAYLSFFALPGDGWKWRFDIAAFDLTILGLDLNHIGDFGTTWQTCHAWQAGSPQYEWYREQMDSKRGGFTVSLQNERNGQMRAKETPNWHSLFSRGTLVISGFGYFAEKAVVDGFPYYNSALSGKGAAYKDAKSAFFANEDSYVLLTFKRGSDKVKVELKGLDGRVLHADEHLIKKADQK